MTEQVEAIAKVPTVSPLAIQNRQDLWSFAKCVSQSGLAPKSFDTPEKVMVALQCGIEIGMTPMRSLQSFCVINGMARLYGDAPLAMVRQSGLLESITEQLVGEGDDAVQICTTVRKGDSESHETRFSVKDAKRAGLWGKQGPWTQYPKRMLMYRARSFNLRDTFPDVFGGATIAEEFYEIEPGLIDVASDFKPEPNDAKEASVDDESPVVAQPLEPEPETEDETPPAEQTEASTGKPSNLF